jgi:hypothetical protein
MLWLQVVSCAVGCLCAVDCAGISHECVVVASLVSGWLLFDCNVLLRFICTRVTCILRVRVCEQGLFLGGMVDLIFFRFPVSVFLSVYFTHSAKQIMHATPTHTKAEY